MRNPYVMNFNASVQYEFTRNYLLDVSYQGSGGVGLIEQWQANTFPIDYFSGNATQQNAVRAAVQNFRPFPQFGDIRFRSNFGHSTYHSGTAKLEKRYSDGLFFSTFYTFQKTIDSQNSNSVFSGANNGFSNFALPGGCPAVIPAGFDRTQCDFRIGNAGRNILTGTPLRWTTISAQKNFQFTEKWKAQLRWDMQNAFKTFNFNTPDTTVDFRNPQNFGKVTGDPTTASFGGQPLMNLTLRFSFNFLRQAAGRSRCGPRNSGNARPYRENCTRLRNVSCPCAVQNEHLASTQQEWPASCTRNQCDDTFCEISWNRRACGSAFG